jgi:hypothetical protein
MATSVDHEITIRRAAEEGKLVVIFGTGLSTGLTRGTSASMTWKGLVADGLEYARLKGRMSEDQLKRWQPILESDDLDDLLGAAELMTRRLGAPSDDLFARWLDKVFKKTTVSDDELQSAVQLVGASGARIGTLNYDTLAEQCLSLPSVRLDEKPKVGDWVRGDFAGVLHLHGVWDVPESCVIGVRDYNDTLTDEFRNLLQKSLGAFHQLLFVGCGDTFADPNFSALIKWLRNTVSTAALQHFALVVEAEAETRHRDPSWEGFVEPLAYGPRYDDLPRFLNRLFSGLQCTARQTQTRKIATRIDVERIASYRKFLVRDSGFMSIEGVNADFDTAQKRFEIEKLFIPQNVAAIPPEIAINDPDRERKLRDWHDAHPNIEKFGTVFEHADRLALLALPGGGKTMLLKRLAVAYADPTRREASEDELPDLDILPVLIRCREWRDVIAKPIPVLLESLPDVTGQKSIEGIHEEILSLAAEGKVLLLIDGLDEIHSDADRAAFVANLEMFLNDYPKVRLVVTSREAGFALVAPTIARFCARWGIAPLGEEAIRLLSRYWHRLMVGISAASDVEAEAVADRIIGYPALRRLAENPLLLTMLLVVKHGAGQLPVDRVGLYERAVEVLLDTWNIKGHAPLNTKECVPQLACVAYELLKAGKQTATKEELLSIIETARREIARIKLYAHGTPDEFLRRVELRSSLLVEAGHQVQGARTVPFYQFRHLTFQEYLAAVAASGGYYLAYAQKDNVLTPLEEFLTAEEWKEVVPMAAALAKKQSEPLVAALVEEGEKFAEKLRTGAPFVEISAELAPNALPAPCSRLVQCLVDEVEASTPTLTAAEEQILLFARGCRSSDDWISLATGPFGDQILDTGWRMYKDLRYPADSWLSNTIAVLASYRYNRLYPDSTALTHKVAEFIRSGDERDQSLGLFVICGAFWGSLKNLSVADATVLLPLAEERILSSTPHVHHLASWAWGLLRYILEDFGSPPPLARDEVLDRLFEHWLSPVHDDFASRYAFALQSVAGLPQETWRPVFRGGAVDVVQGWLRNRSEDFSSDLHQRVAALYVASRARSKFADRDIRDSARYLSENGPHFRPRIANFIKRMARVPEKNGRRGRNKGKDIRTK